MVRLTLLLIWKILICTEVLLFALLIYRRAWKTHPVFFTYIGFLLVESLALLHTHGKLYGVLFYIGMACKSVILVALLIELLHQVFVKWSWIPRRPALAFLNLFCFYTAVAAVWALLKPTHHWTFLATFERTVWAGAGAALLVMTVASRWFAMPWPRKSYGIGSGLLLVAIVYTTCIALNGSSTANLVLSIVHMSAFLVALVLWIWYFARPEAKAFSPEKEQLERARGELDTIAAVVGKE